MSIALHDRMKGYEAASRYVLPARMPVIIRVDGRSFHSLLRGRERPWDPEVERAMMAIGVALVRELDGAVLAYGQSDEVSVLLHNYKTLHTQAWFDNVVQKLASVSASIATCAWTMRAAADRLPYGTFDARAFVLPEAEVCNYFIWRQQDAMRNSVQLLAEVHMSHNQRWGMSCENLKEVLKDTHNADWHQLPQHRKQGWCVDRLESAAGKPIAGPAPDFIRARHFVERHLAVKVPEPKPVFLTNKVLG